eukprot:10086372-Alexandrium_andersonii.AAC.1
MLDATRVDGLLEAQRSPPKQVLLDARNLGSTLLRGCLGARDERAEVLERGRRELVKNITEDMLGLCLREDLLASGGVVARLEDAQGLHRETSAQELFLRARNI